MPVLFDNPYVHHIGYQAVLSERIAFFWRLCCSVTRAANVIGNSHRATPAKAKKPNAKGQEVEANSQEANSRRQADKQSSTLKAKGQEVEAESRVAKSPKSKTTAQKSTITPPPHQKKHRPPVKINPSLQAPRPFHRRQLGNGLCQGPEQSRHSAIETQASKNFTT